jgi:type II secretory pathway pseudopilin PulG
MRQTTGKEGGFTIVELLIVIVTIAILAAITIVAYSGIQERARQTQLKADLRNVERLIEVYNAENGHYPITAAELNPDWGTETARTDANCTVGTQSTAWVPDVTASLPQSNDNSGVGGLRGCFMYVSDGDDYVLSAWNMLSTPQTDNLYRRLGFRETDAAHSNQFYICNHSVLGGESGGYAAGNDYYKHSYTVSNIESCNETPPPGA